MTIEFWGAAREVTVDFQAQVTLGRQLVDGARHIRWRFRNRPPVALVHGEPSAMGILAGRLRDELSVRVTLPKSGDCIEI